jgi:nucleoside-diphosphate-sugar epimerase
MSTLHSQFATHEEQNSYWRMLAKILAPLVPSHKPGRILVTDGDGAVGFRVAKLLLAAGYDHTKIRIGTSELHAIPDLAAAAEVVMFDWSGDSFHFDDVLKDINTVLCVPPDTVAERKHMTGKFAAFLKSAKKAGVKHFVKLSSYHALTKPEDPEVDFEHTDRHGDPYQRVQLVKDMGTMDEMLLHCPTMDYTILFASHLASDPLRFQGELLKKEHKFLGASDGKGVNYGKTYVSKWYPLLTKWHVHLQFSQFLLPLFEPKVSPNDVAEMAVRIMLEPKDHYRTGYTVTGPATITDNEVAELLTKKYAVPIAYEEAPLNKFSKDHADLELIKSTGWEERTSFLSQDFEDVVGHEGQTYEQFLAATEMFSPKERLVMSQTAQ